MTIRPRRRSREGHQPTTSPRRPARSVNATRTDRRPERKGVAVKVPLVLPRMRKRKTTDPDAAAPEGLAPRVRATASRPEAPRADVVRKLKTDRRHLADVEERDLVVEKTPRPLLLGDAGQDPKRKTVRRPLVDVEGQNRERWTDPKRVLREEGPDAVPKVTDLRRHQEAAEAPVLEATSTAKGRLHLGEVREGPRREWKARPATVVKTGPRPRPEPVDARRHLAKRKKTTIAPRVGAAPRCEIRLFRSAVSSHRTPDRGPPRSLRERNRGG